MIKPIAYLLKLMTAEDNWQKFLDWLKDKNTVHIYTQYDGHEILSLGMNIKSPTTYHVIFQSGAGILTLWRNLIKEIDITEDMAELRSNKMFIRIKK